MHFLFTDIKSVKEDWMGMEAADVDLLLKMLVGLTVSVFSKCVDQEVWLYGVYAFCSAVTRNVLK